jgi:hypothetical protein
MACEKETCQATSVRWRWQRKKKADGTGDEEIPPEVKDMFPVDAKTGEKILYAGIMTLKPQCVEALEKALAAQSVTTVTSCGSKCGCIFPTPAEDDYVFKADTLTTEFDYKPQRDSNEVQRMRISFKADKAVVTKDGKCELESGAK